MPTPQLCLIRWLWHRVFLFFFPAGFICSMHSSLQRILNFGIFKLPTYCCKVVFADLRNISTICSCLVGRMAVCGLSDCCFWMLWTVASVFNIWWEQRSLWKGLLNCFCTSVTSSSSTLLRFFFLKSLPYVCHDLGWCASSDSLPIVWCSSQSQNDLPQQPYRTIPSDYDAIHYSNNSISFTQIIICQCDVLQCDLLCS